MFLVVGLGNPGKQHEGNRHNLGFMVLDEIRRAAGLSGEKAKFSGLLLRSGDVVLLKPQTYMNASGESVEPAAAFLKVPPERVIVVHDELDLPWGYVRLKVGGGHAGHNGLRSIIERMGPDFVRVRVGVGKPPAGFLGDVVDWVLADFDAVERAELPNVVEHAADAVRRVLEDGLHAAMNVVNTKKK